MNRKLNILFWLWCQTVLFQTSANTQRHLPDLQIFHTVESIQLDTRFEEPAINNGIPVADIPGRGQNVVFQIFVPRSAGLIAYECSVQLENPDSVLTHTFGNITVTDWQKQSLNPLPGETHLGFENKRLEFAPLPYSGHIATATLTPLQNLQDPLPLTITCSVTVVSDPPRRVWRMTGTQTLRWR